MGHLQQDRAWPPCLADTCLEPGPPFPEPGPIRAFCPCITVNKVPTFPSHYTHCTPVWVVHYLLTFLPV